jgi:hypothetical protein
MTLQFDLDGQEFTALNGGPMCRRRRAMSSAGGSRSTLEKLSVRDGTTST